MVITGITSAEVIYFKPYDGVPNYKEFSPFQLEESKIESLIKHTASLSNDKECSVAEISAEHAKYTLKSNVCKKSDFDKATALIQSVAPKLIKNNITFWLHNIDKDIENELIIGYVDISNSEHFKYPYFSLWSLNKKQGKYETSFLGTYLNGSLLGINNFSQGVTTTAFVKYVSCIECEPWVYLTLIDLSVTSSAKSEGFGKTNKYWFTYDSTHDVYSESMEYALPGHGHSTDADVETRLPKKNKHGIDAIQNFKLKDGGNEWWYFSCKKKICDYVLYKGDMPNKYAEIWDGAIEL